MEKEIAQKKLIELETHLRNLKSVAVAFSGGVDSSFLLYTANRVLGENCIAVTAKSPTYPKRELDEAKELCKKMNVKHIVFDSSEMNEKNFTQNSAQRCYYCKSGLYKDIIKIAKEEGILYIADGSNKDDEGDYRPGIKATEEMNVISPLRDVGMTKDEIRYLSQQANLPTWNKPSFACLSSRIPYGDTITEDKLDMIDKAEQLLFDEGFSQVRVRVHDRLARIEVKSEDIDKLTEPEFRNMIVKRFKEMGFLYVTADLTGYRSGSMNEALKND